VKLDDVDRYRVIDPLFESVRIVLSHRGESYSPAYIQGISGMAFRIGGPCPCAPTSTFAVWVPDFVRLLGYEAVESGLEKVEREEAPNAVEGIIEQVKAEVKKGRPVIVWHAFTNAEFDVVTGFDEDKQQFIGYGTYCGNDREPARAKEDRMGTCLNICPAYGALFIGEKTGTLDTRQTELSALEEAVRHAHAPRDPFLDAVEDVVPPWRFRNGLACYDTWIRQFEIDPNKVPSPSSDCYPLGVYHSTRAEAPTFLREIAPKYPDAAEQLETAAGHFAEDAKALRTIWAEVFRAWQKDQWKKPDPAKAKRTAELFRQARNHYAAGIDALAKALTVLDPPRAERANRHARIRREDGKVWIDGLTPPLTFGDGHDNTFCGTLRQAMRHTDHPYVYNDLMGLSGLAFRVRWGNENVKTKWCPSAAIGEMPDEQAALSSLTGWELLVQSQTYDKGGDELRKRIVADIDAGRPIAGYADSWNMALLYGYENDGRTLWASDYVSDDHPHKVAMDKLVPLRFYLGDWHEPPSMCDCLHQALNAALRHWTREKHDGGLQGREYWYGEAAFDAWLSDLRRHDTLSAESRAGFDALHPWNLRALADARRAARGFLGDWSTVAPPAAREKLKLAADLYGREAELLKPLLMKDDKGDLPPETREGHLTALTQAKAIDSQAIEAIKEALKAFPIETELPAGVQTKHK